jgi:DNA anti-recombination protein RmuC
MVLRLSELLERIRPAGAPGVASEGEHQAEHLSAQETADLARVLGDFAAEADLEISDAHERAQQIRQEAEQRAHQDRADLPDRIAAARASGASSLVRQRDAELSRIADETARELDRLDAQARTQLPRLVDAAIASIWGAFDIEDHPGGAS